MKRREWGGYYKDREGVVGGSGRGREGTEGRKGVWSLSRGEGVRKGITKAGTEGFN